MANEMIAEREQLKALVRQLIKYLERAINGEANPRDYMDEDDYSQYNKIFGIRVSYLSALVDVGELLLKLDRGTMDPIGELPLDTSRKTIDPKDVAWVEDFIHRQKLQQLNTVPEILPA